MHRIQSRTLQVAFLALLALLLAGCSQATTPDASPTTHVSLYGSASVQSIEIDLLTVRLEDGGTLSVGFTH